ncbi:SCO family protein [Thermogemmatispora sp.]|uniref:SCO family protein n=1 Tax=Thermogemmatispora sp. TaxID=1968838 RepID=UPI001E0A3EE0|nr:SCO family protein [Thermogemmatispora sp.]MBX5451270.1 SCO family protein [Thermogemmatispora sp.]
MRWLNWRLASRLSVLTMALLVVLVVAVLNLRAGQGGNASGQAPGQPTASNSGLQGTLLDGRPAPGFQLTDQFGHPVSLAEFKGKPVVITFLYTHCPTVCPLTADKLHTVMQQLGDAAQQVAVLAISVDPVGDTQASALAFSNAHQMTNYWHFLIGSRSALSPIWRAYSIDAEAATANSSTGPVAHTAVLYLLDKQGRERVLLGDDFIPSQLTGDLQLLLKE